MLKIITQLHKSPQFIDNIVRVLEYIPEPDVLCASVLENIDFLSP